MKNPLISVIIPCYNSEEWIIDSLQSIYNQTYKNFEVIIVDDGSDDNTQQVVEQFDASIIYKYQENKGPAAARNLGGKLANGEYIAFLDSDDLWEENKLQKQISYINANKEVDLILTNVTVVDEDKKYLFKHYNKVPKFNDELIIELFLGNIVMNTPTILVKKKVFDEVSGFPEDLPMREDHYFLMKVSNNHRIAHIKDHLVKRRIRESSISHDISPNNILSMNQPFINLSIKNFPILKKYKKQVLSDLYLSLAKKYWSLGKFKESKLHIYRSLKYNNTNFKSHIYWLLIFLKLDHTSIIKLIYKTKRILKKSS